MTWSGVSVPRLDFAPSSFSRRRSVGRMIWPVFLKKSSVT